MSKSATAKPFEKLYERNDPLTGERLEWVWDDEEMAFVAEDQKGNTYKITPVLAEIEVEAVDLDEDEIDEDE